MVNPRHKPPQGQSLAKPATPLWNMLVENLNIASRIPKLTCSIQYSNGKCPGTGTSREVSACRTSDILSWSLSIFYLATVASMHYVILRGNISCDHTVMGVFAFIALLYQGKI